MTELVLKQVLKFIEMVLKDENDFEISEFYPHEIFHEGALFESFFEKS